MLTINASWLRNWLYHGRHLLFGVAGLQPVLRGDPGAISYSHEITAVSDAGVFVVICIAFLVIAIVATGFVAMCVLIDSPAEPGGPRRSGGGPPGPELSPEPPRWRSGAPHCRRCGRIAYGCHPACRDAVVTSVITEVAGERATTRELAGSIRSAAFRSSLANRLRRSSWGKARRARRDRAARILAPSHR